MTHLLAVRDGHVLALLTVDKGRLLVVEAVEAVGVLVHKVAAWLATVATGSVVATR